MMGDAMGSIFVFGVEQHEEWKDVLHRCYIYDFYHTPDYHRLAEKRGEGKAVLFVYQVGDYHLALPMLYRSVGNVQGLEGSDWQDVTSVYGYAGPLASSPQVPGYVIQEFWMALSEFLREQKVVSLFSRLHPLIPMQVAWCSGMGEISQVGLTVSIDLTIPEDVQWSFYRSNHRRGVNKLKRLGVSCCRDEKGMYLNNFIEIYYQNMQRVNADPFYFFEEGYFKHLLEAHDFETHLFICKLDEKIICGGLFTLCNGIVQYHLGATHTDFLKLAPMKLLLDSVRVWANQRQACVFHLGGGVGGKEDSLYHFKAGFSNQRHPFYLWRWIVNEKAYKQLTKIKAEWNAKHGLKWKIQDFFPAYRCPTISA